MQLRYATNLTDEQYICQKGWKGAKLSRCPLHPAGGCEFSRHTPYERRRPAGALIARFYCRTARVTFSLLPDCLASRLSGSLAEVEEVVKVAEAAPSQTQAAEQLRPDLADVRDALKWLRRRTKPVRTVLTALVTLYPGLSGVAPRIDSIRDELGVEQVLVCARELMSDRLLLLCHPIGLSPRVPVRNGRREAAQHKVGPDPPA